MKVLLFLVLFVGFSVVEGLTVHCMFRKIKYWNSKELTCTAKGLQIVEPFVNITNVLETSYSSYFPKDVKAFAVIDQNMEYLPYKFDVFPELSFLWVQHSNQKFILKTDFTNLPKLEHIHFHEGEITEFDKDTFVNTPELWYITISHHKIKSLPKCLFRNLAKLKLVSFQDNQLEFIDGDLFKNNLMINMVRFDDNHLKIIGTNLLDNFKFLEVVWLQKNECIDMKSDDYEIYQIKDHYQKACSNETFENESKMKNCMEPAEENNHKIVILLIIFTTLTIIAIAAALMMYKKTPKITEIVPNASYNTKTDNLNVDSTVDAEEPFNTTLSTI